MRGCTLPVTGSSIRWTSWTPPADLLEFLQAGAPPIFIGFGSLSPRNPEAMTQVILQALARTQQRAIVLSGWGGLHSNDLPDSVYMLDSIPFSWLFPRVAAVVHHGGVGTTASSPTVRPHFDEHMQHIRVVIKLESFRHAATAHVGVNCGKQREAFTDGSLPWTDTLCHTGH